MTSNTSLKMLQAATHIAAGYLVACKAGHSLQCPTNIVEVQMEVGCAYRKLTRATHIVSSKLLRNNPCYLLVSMKQGFWDCRHRVQSFFGVASIRRLKGCLPVCLVVCQVSSHV